MNGLTKSAQDVLAERQRQVEREGWTPEHDDLHRDGDLADAASCYAIQAGRYVRGVTVASLPPPGWPWQRTDWKPKDARSNLVRAGALILAEIERLDRAVGASAEMQSPPEGGEGLVAQKEPRERRPCKHSDCATEPCPYVGYCNEEGLCENGCEIRQRVNAARAAQAPEEVRPCTHCGESEPWVGLCDRLGNLCGTAAARDHADGVAPSQAMSTETARELLAAVKAELPDPRDCWLHTIVSLVTWDDQGAVAPVREGMSWESVARLALDYAKAAIEDAADGVKTPDGSQQ